MKKFIHIRGSMAVGKTSTARGFISKGNFKSKAIEVQGKEYPYLYDDERKIVVTGKYDNRECGGLDGVIVNRTVMIEYILKILKTVSPEFVVFEAVMYGCTVKFAEELAALIGKYGYEYVGLALLPPLDVAIQRVYTRNGGKEINLESFVRVYQTSERSYLKLKAKGYNIKAVDTSKFRKEDMWKIVQGEIG